MLLSLLLKTEGNRISFLPERDFEYWYSHNKLEFWAYIFAALMFLLLIIVSVLYLTENYRAEARKKREAKRLERDEAVKKELERISRCEVTLIFCYDDKTKTLVHKKNCVFNPEFPSREGYSFDGWYTDSARTTPFQNKVITDNLTLYAKWTKEAD